MKSIGPQIPVHLASHRADDEDDGAAPQPAGPQIPSHLLGGASAVAAEDDEDEDDDSYGPALPPDLLVARKRTSSSAVAAAAGPSSSPPLARRVVGPSLPGHDRQTYSYPDADADDDGYGPMPLPEGAQSTDGVSEGVREFLEKEEKRRKEIEEAVKPKQPKRDEWMLVPPSSSDILGRLSDPTKLKARQFSRGAGAASRSAPNNLWTETPAERQQRIADEVSGKKRRAANAADDTATSAEDHKRRRHDEEVRKVVQEHNKSSRNKSLLEMHSSNDGSSDKVKKPKDESEPPGIWDHARDMALGGRLMDEKQRSKLISDARSLGDRFGSGKGGGYL
ncbi:hypothetical protein EW145_g1231 [Phellinidium pouzarii]|uniref:DUF3752 domain-containing protein n=1 Tax=Phellinidium pouzarii TaxID=167371 RepID=A0A4S4LFI9_9AGAM|nr:hypothetical protein EW145_g1231 [Phellinidium pouzarii]